MTRKHFQAIAEVMAETRPGPLPENEHDWGTDQYVAHDCRRRQWDQTVRLMADVCGRFNANFDRIRFVDACEATYVIRDGKLVRVRVRRMA